MGLANRALVSALATVSLPVQLRVCIAGVIPICLRMKTKIGWKEHSI